MDGNQLKAVPASFSGLVMLRDLSMAKNKIALIEEDCLSSLSNLVMLDLH